jgi:Zn-dependent protease
MDVSNIIVNITFLAPAILFALTVHEASHALVALWFGDPTAKMAGRLTLNPLKHLDVMGTIVFFITAMAGAGMGWAKPVPVDGRNLKNPRKDNIWISASGPISNILAAIGLSIVLRVLMGLGVFQSDAAWLQWLATVLFAGVRINLVLAFFNMIPLPPLDGSGVLMGILPHKMAAQYYQISRYGMLIILAMIILPSWLPGFPNLLVPLVIYPANGLLQLLLPMLY